MNERTPSTSEQMPNIHSEEDADYFQKIEKWRKERDDSFRSPDGWLSLVGLFVLEDGEYTIGSADGDTIRGTSSVVTPRIVLPEGAPAELGSLSVDHEGATLVLTTEAEVLVNGAPVEPYSTVEMVDNRNRRSATIIKVGPISMNLHHFGGQIALRVRDASRPEIRAFKGCSWYEIQPAYRVRGKLTRFERPEAIGVVTSVNSTDQYRTVGVVDFELFGQPLQLLAAAASKPNELFIIFRDGTTGRQSYPAGRYLYAELIVGGEAEVDEEVIIDFNKAYSPPCAFTPYATCALPPKQNTLPVAIEAGELYPS